jgi:hypothetical protein
LIEFYYFNSNFKKKQSQAFWKLRDNIDKELSNEGIRDLLEYNEQSIGKGVGRDDVIF